MSYEADTQRQRLPQISFVQREQGAEITQLKTTKLAQRGKSEAIYQRHPLLGQRTAKEWRRRSNSVD